MLASDWCGLHHTTCNSDHIYFCAHERHSLEGLQMTTDVPALVASPAHRRLLGGQDHSVRPPRPTRSCARASALRAVCRLPWHCCATWQDMSQRTEQGSHGAALARAPSSRARLCCRKVRMAAGSFALPRTAADATRAWVQHCLVPGLPSTKAIRGLV